MLSEDREAQFDCASGAVDYFIRDPYSDLWAKAFCEHLDMGLRVMCLQETEEYYTILQSPSERRKTAL
jgi:hypothetical protein